MDALEAKIICTFAILLLKLVFGLLPCSLRRPLRRLITGSTERRKYFVAFIGYLSCFAAGVLLSVSFLHLFPESQQLMADAWSPDQSAGKFPLAEMLNVLGMFLVLFIDRSIHSIQQGRCRRKQTRVESAQTLLSKESITSRMPNAPSGKYGAHRDVGMSDIIAEIPAEDSTRTGSENMCLSEKEEEQNKNCLPDEHQESQHLYEESNELKSPTYTVVFLLALSFHGFFEGMALGLQKTSTDIWTLFIGIALHEVVLSFTLGWELDRYTRRRYHCILGVTAFALISALGVILGTILDSASDSDVSLGPTVSVLHCLANGSILYIIFFEIFLRELNDNYGFAKVIAALVGFGLMTLIFGVTHHQH